MAIYHCSIKIIGRSGQKSAVASAAYRACNTLFDEEQGKQIDYQKKTGLEFSEIILCKNAPQEYANRETLWNEVQKVEKVKDAQFAREFVVSIPVELNKEQRRELVHNFAQTLANEGMCVDVNIHNKGDGNPHAHIMVTTRGIDENGKWRNKEKKDYALDVNGDRIPIIDPKTGEQKLDSRKRKQWKRVTIEANNWNSRDKCLEWRTRWRVLANKYLEEEEQIDERSYKEQGVDLIPTIPEGYYARKIAQEGGVSLKCEYNKIVKKRNLRRYSYMASPLFSFEGNWYGKSSQIFLTRNKKVAFVDIKDSILVRRYDTKTLAEALQHAQKKWGRVKIHGSKEYIDKCIELAIRNDITITNPELQEQIEAKKQALAKQEQNNNFKEKKEQEYHERLSAIIAERNSLRAVREAPRGQQGIDYEAELSKLVVREAERKQREAERKQREAAGREQEAAAEARYQERQRLEERRRERETEAMGKKADAMGRHAEATRRLAEAERRHAEPRTKGRSR